MKSCLLTLIASPLLLIGCSDDSAFTASGLRPTVLVDTKSFEAFAVPEIPKSLPAVHPQTGRRTLMPGLYCPDCQQWHPVPPLEEMTHLPGSRKCPKTGVSLVPEGPLPDETLN